MGQFSKNGRGIDFPKVTEGGFRPFLNILGGVRAMLHIIVMLTISYFK